MLGVITCVCALRLAAALDIPLEGKSCRTEEQSANLTFVSKHLGGRGNFFCIFVHKRVKMQRACGGGRLMLLELKSLPEKRV